jgi:hypothetical protein
MKNRSRISYTFLLLVIGIVSTILSNPILAQTEGNAQNQTGSASGGGQQQGSQTPGTAGGQQPQPSEQGQQQQGGNQSKGPLGEVGEAIGKLFQ